MLRIEKWNDIKIKTPPKHFTKFLIKKGEQIKVLTLNDINMENTDFWIPIY